MRFIHIKYVLWILQLVLAGEMDPQVFKLLVNTERMAVKLME